MHCILRLHREYASLRTDTVLDADTPNHLVTRWESSTDENACPNDVRWIPRRDHCFPKKSGRAFWFPAQPAAEARTRRLWLDNIFPLLFLFCEFQSTQRDQQLEVQACGVEPMLENV